MDDMYLHHIKEKSGNYTFTAASEDYLIGFLDSSAMYIQRPREEVVYSTKLHMVL